MRLQAFRRPNSQPFSKSSNFSTIPQRAQIDSIRNLLFNSCLNACRRNDTRRVFDERPQRKYSPSSAVKILHAHSVKHGVGSYGQIGNAIVNLYAKCGNLDYAEKAFSLLDKRDVLAWNSLLSVYSMSGLWDKVVQSFGYVQVSGGFPNQHTYAIVLSACGRLMAVRFGRQVHCSVIKMGFEFDSFCEGSLIGMYAKSNSVAYARRVFIKAIDPDTVSWVAMVAGYVQSGFPLRRH